MLRSKGQVKGSSLPALGRPVAGGNSCSVIGPLFVQLVGSINRPERYSGPSQLTAKGHENPQLGERLRVLKAYTFLG